MQQHSESKDQVALTMEQNTIRPKPCPILTRLPVSKPKSRFLEQNYPSPNIPTPSIPEPIPASDPAYDSDYDSESDTKPISTKFHPKHNRLIGPRALIELLTLIILTALLVTTILVPNVKKLRFWNIELWEWAIMLLVVFCGRLVSNWLVWLAVFFIERNFPLQEKILYFVYGLRRSVRSCVWLGLILISWEFLFVQRHYTDSPAVRRISRALVAIFIACTIWLLKILLVKVLASSFHVRTFFDRMKVSVFHHYILEKLSGDPIGAGDSVDKLERKDKWRRVVRASTIGGSKRIDMNKLRELSRSTTAVFSVKRLVWYVMRHGLTTVSRTVDHVSNSFGQAEAESDITSQHEAKNAAKRVFKNVARHGKMDIEEEDLSRFLTEEEVHTIFPYFEGALETGKISKYAFRNWVVRAYTERKSLAHALNDTKTAVQQLHKIASAAVSVIIIVVTILVMGLASTKVFMAVVSQLLLAGFLFQSTGKTVFESIIFVFVMHPFDAGDRCVIDGVQMIVEQMNILTTVFLRFDNEKIYYPNSVLLTKPISNFYRSPNMGDTIEFSIGYSTDEKTVSLLKKSIQTYLDNNPKYWQQKHSVLVKEIENVNKMKMALNVLHTINHQNIPERNRRRSELVFELKNIFENLGIKYHLLPQEVHLTQVVMAEGRIPPISSDTRF